MDNDNSDPPNDHRFQNGRNQHQMRRNEPFHQRPTPGGFNNSGSGCGDRRSYQHNSSEHDRDCRNSGSDVGRRRSNHQYNPSNDNRKANNSGPGFRDRRPNQYNSPNNTREPNNFGSGDRRSNQYNSPNNNREGKDFGHRRSNQYNSPNDNRESNNSGSGDHRPNQYDPPNHNRECRNSGFQDRRSNHYNQPSENGAPPYAKRNYLSSENFRPNKYAGSFGGANRSQNRPTQFSGSRVPDRRSSHANESAGQSTSTGTGFRSEESTVVGGVKGMTTDLACNFIKLGLIDPSRSINEYEVTFEPDVEDRRRKSRLVNKHAYTVFGEKVVKLYDLGRKFWSPLKSGKEVCTAVHETNGEQVAVTFKWKGERKIVDCRIILNVIMKRIMSESELVRIKRSDFNPRMAHMMPEYKLEIWPGFVSVIEDFDGGILLNLDTSFRVLQTGTIYNILSQLLKAGGTSSKFREECHRCLLGLSVMTKYNKKIIRIDDIDFDSNPLSTFERKGQKITYKDYYKTQYNLDIQDLHQPMLIHRVKRKPMDKESEEILNYYVPELCHPSGLSSDQKLNFKLMKELARITQLTPEKRNNNMIRFLENVNGNENCQKLLNDWGLKIPTQAVQLQGRTFEPEKIHFGRNRTAQESSADWGRALSREHVLKPVPVDEWAILYTFRDERVANTFSSKMVEVSRRFGINACAPKFRVKVDSERTEDYCHYLRNLGRVQIVVIIFPSKKDDRYKAVKKLCNELGIPSQVIISKTLQNPERLDGVLIKVVMQMNCKIGGALWGINLPHKEEGVMVCGLESYHDSEALSPGVSVAALVCTVDKNATQWSSHSVLMPAGQIIHDKLRELFKPCLQEWFKLNGQYPQRIILYRSGVGDGQLDTVQNFEIKQLKCVFTDVAADYKPDLVFVVVQAKNNMRYYAKKTDGCLDNPPPGTVLDHTVTKRNLQDFYLISPTVRQGTVAPTHYIVLENSSDMTTELIQSITFKFTHLYYNWNATIRVPAPCQYAQKLALQVGMQIPTPTAPSMKNTLYFL